MKPLSQARVAVVNEWIESRGGAEKVLEAVLAVFPRADLFATAYDPDALRGTPLEKVPIKTTFVQRLPASRRLYRTYLPLMPFAVEQLDLRPYDLIISLSHAAAKGVLTRPGQLHISYTHTPLRYAWDLQFDYLETSFGGRGPKRWLARLALHYLRLWDVAASNRVDVYLANSRHVARRIRKLYRREARVLHPPVAIGRYRHGLPREDFYVTVSRLTPYKRVDLIVEAFNRLGKPLVVIGDGPELERLRSAAASNVRLPGGQPDEAVADCLQRARAFVFAAEEDFGIAPVEAQAAGCPVIAYGRGGALETVTGWPETGATGIFFEQQTPESLAAAVRAFESERVEIRAEACRHNAERFGGERFLREFEAILEDLWHRFQQGKVLDFQ